MQVFADDGARIDVRVGGRDGDCAVVLIHGFPLTREIWTAQFEAASRSRRVVLPDLRGFGSSSVAQGPYLMERLAADVAAVLDALGIERAAIAGHSMGGYVAMAFARMYAERVAGIALVASRLRADTPQEAAARRELADRVEREGSIAPAVQAYLPRMIARPPSATRPELLEEIERISARNSAGGAAAALRGMALRSASDDIAEDLDVPMAMIAGACDAIVGIDEARAVAGSFARGRLYVCERSGHLPMLEEPECVSRALASWLEAAR